MEQSNVTRRSLLRATIIEWDGTQVPKELRELPPGRYMLSDPYWDDDETTEEEEAGVLLAIEEMEAGQVIPYEDAMRELRAIAQRTTQPK
jgi:hypothetical protein